MREFKAPDPDEVARAIDAIGRLDNSHMLIQGPPGAGKTFTASHAIVEMLARGKRVGVSSLSHNGINNLLKAVETVATARGLWFRGIKKSSYEEQFLNGAIIVDTTDNGEAASGRYDLIAGTAWLFAREELDQQIDVILVGDQLTKGDDKAHRVVDYTVPELGQKLLPFLLPKKLRVAVAGDLEEDFQGYAEKFGRTYAVRWYWWELGWLCISRLKFPAVVTAVAFWLRRQIGF
jgi:hypothetical protein